jgi:hypothetical protein
LVLVIDLSRAGLFTHPMAQEPQHHDAATTNSERTVFVRDFVGKLTLLCLYHDLGKVPDRGEVAGTVCPDALRMSKVLSELIRKNIVGNFHPLMDKENGFPKALATITSGSAKPVFSEATFRALIKSDMGVGADCLTTARKDCSVPRKWFAYLHTVFALTTVGNLLNFEAWSDPDGRPFETANIAGRYLPIKAGDRNRHFLQLFAGARLKERSGRTLGTLERTTDSLIKNGYHRNRVHEEAPYEPNDRLVTEVETDILLRLAIGFGFGCNCPETAALATWDNTIENSNKLVCTAWRYFAGLVDKLGDGREVRGSTLENFSGAYFDLLRSVTMEGAEPVGFLFRGGSIQRRRKLGQQQPEESGSRKLQEGFTEYEFEIHRIPIARTENRTSNFNNVDYHLEFLSTGQGNVGLQVFVGWSVGTHKYAFKDMLLKLDTEAFQLKLRIEPESWPTQPVAIANGGQARFNHPGLGPDFKYKITLSDVTNLPERAVFAPRHAELFRFARVEEGASFDGAFQVRAGSLACVDDCDNSAKGALRIAVEQFLAAWGQQDDTDECYITMAAKSWTVRKRFEG